MKLFKIFFLTLRSCELYLFMQSSSNTEYPRVFPRGHFFVPAKRYKVYQYNEMINKSFLVRN